MSTAVPNSPFLQDNFAPWRGESDHPTLRVIGELPRDLNGTFYRNGPNPAFDPINRYHWFDGDGMVHAVTLRDGTASYRNRYVRSAGLAEEIAAGRALYPSLLDLDALGEMPRFKNTGNTNIVAHAGRLLALMEACLPTELRPGTLETLGEYDFAGRLGTAMTAHPKRDPDSGELLFFGYAPVPPYLTYHVADAAGRLVRSEPIDLAWPSMLHDFATTRDHVLFILCPLVFSFENLAASGRLFAWEPERGTRLGVMPRAGGNADVRWFTVEPGYVFHPLNAYDDAERLVCEVARFGAMRFMDPDAATSAGEEDRPRLHRWTIDLARGDVRSEPLDDRSGEFPRVDERRLGLRHRFGYLAGTVPDAPAPVFNAVLKYDLQTGRREAHELGDRRCGEAVFVPRTPEAAEDDGYLLTFVYDPSRNASELLLLDARAVAAAPLARIEIPHRVPFGFHGNWVADG